MFFYFSPIIFQACVIVAVLNRFHVILFHFFTAYVDALKKNTGLDHPTFEELIKKNQILSKKDKNKVTVSDL